MMISDTPSGRLYKAMVPTKLAASVIRFTMDQYAGIVMFGATLQPGSDQAKSLDTLKATLPLNPSPANPFTWEELDRAPCCQKLGSTVCRCARVGGVGLSKHLRSATGACCSLRATAFAVMTRCYSALPRPPDPVSGRLEVSAFNGQTGACPCTRATRTLRKISRLPGEAYKAGKPGV